MYYSKIMQKYHFFNFLNAQENSFINCQLCVVGVILQGSMVEVT